MGKTGETFRPDRKSKGLMARRDLGDWPPSFGTGSLIVRIRIWAAGRVLQPVGSNCVLMKTVQTKGEKRVLATPEWFSGVCAEVMIPNLVEIFGV